MRSVSLQEGKRNFTGNSHYSFPSFSFKEISLLSSILLDSHSSLEIISSESLWLFCLLFHLFALQEKQNGKPWYNFNLYRARKVVGALIFTDVSFISGLPTHPFNSLCSKFGQIPEDFFFHNALGWGGGLSPDNLFRLSLISLPFLKH